MTYADVIYLLCALTSLACVILLARGYARSRVRLILWCCICFAGLFLNNLLLVIDLTIMTATDLLLVRHLPALFGAGALLFGLIWDGGER